MIRRWQTLVAVLVILCMIGISGIASAQSVLHESQHSHHQAATHASAFCAWSCAAGQTHDASVAPVAQLATILEILDQPSLSYSYNVIPAFRSTRAPPVA
jgi:hypothetical protein